MIVDLIVDLIVVLIVALIVALVLFLVLVLFEISNFRFEIILGSKFPNLMNSKNQTG